MTNPADLPQSLKAKLNSLNTFLKTMIQNMRKCISSPPGIKYRQLNMKKPDVKSNFNGNFKFLYHFSRKQAKQKIDSQNN